MDRCQEPQKSRPLLMIYVTSDHGVNLREEDGQFTALAWKVNVRFAKLYRAG